MKYKYLYCRTQFYNGVGIESQPITKPEMKVTFYYHLNSMWTKVEIYDAFDFLDFLFNDSENKVKVFNDLDAMTAYANAQNEL